MLLSDFDYQLPPGLIAQEPLPGRADSRMLHLDRPSGTLQDCRFRDFPKILRPRDLVIFNDTRVFPARLFGRKVRANDIHGVPASLTSKAVEALLTRQLSETPNEWECLVRPARKIDLGTVLLFGENDELRAEVIGRGLSGERRLRFDPVEDFPALIDRLGHVPLPPYIAREDGPADKERYQTVYARERGSAAAPTAGLHFTPEILAQLETLGIETTQITLHVGLDTFRPVRAVRIEDHPMHREFYRISAESADKINAAQNNGRRIIAIGTTTVRTLEHAAALSGGGSLSAGSNDADIFIYPGYKFRLVNGMLTNFHLPKSTLLMMVSAFAGREQILAAYRHAVASQYRFYSYGDCMFIE
ncbi:MAG: tRNA preQ1(34) S-adenosylmethionine ribosyltransferase-isomerase QueA [Terriglobales bacterium]